MLEKYMFGKSVYTGKLLKLPKPVFVVFYNGSEDAPEKEMLSFSDFYKNTEHDARMPELEDATLELKVLVLNINKGYNNELKERCKQIKHQQKKTIQQKVTRQHINTLTKGHTDLAQYNGCVETHGHFFSQHNPQTQPSNINTERTPHEPATKKTISDRSAPKGAAGIRRNQYPARY